MNDVYDTYDNLEKTYLDITKNYLRLDESSVDRALMQHTGVYSFFGAVLAHAKLRLDESATKLERVEATVREDRREELVSSGKKATDRALDAFVKTVTSVQECEESHRLCAHKYNLAKNIINSLDHQKDMLVQISANKRAETKLISDNYSS
jgi:hypothetical protein